MRKLIQILEASKISKMERPDVRKKKVYEFGSFVRNFAGELAYRAVDRSKPDAQLVRENPKVSRALQDALDVLEDLYTAIFDVEMGTIDIRQPPVRGSLAANEALLGEAVTIGGIRATLERAIAKAEEMAKRVNKSILAAEFKDDMQMFSDELGEIARSVKE